MGSHSLFTGPLFSLQSPSGSLATLMSILFCHRSLIRPWKLQQLYWKANGNMSVNTAERTFMETDTLNGNYHVPIQQSEEPLGLSNIFVMRHTRDESMLRELSSRRREGASVHTALPRNYQVIIFCQPLTWLKIYGFCMSYDLAGMFSLFVHSVSHSLLHNLILGWSLESASSYVNACSSPLLVVNRVNFATISSPISYLNACNTLILWPLE